MHYHDKYFTFFCAICMKDFPHSPDGVHQISAKFLLIEKPLLFFQKFHLIYFDVTFRLRKKLIKLSMSYRICAESCVKNYIYFCFKIKLHSFFPFKVQTLLNKNESYQKAKPKKTINIFLTIMKKIFCLKLEFRIIVTRHDVCE